MIRIEIESDRDVLVDGIGLLPAGSPVVVDEEMRHNFVLRNGVELVVANFPPFVKVTTVVEAPTN